MTTVTVSIVEDNTVIRENVSKFIGFYEEFETGLVKESANMFPDSLIIDTPA